MIHWTPIERAHLVAEREELRTRLRYLDALLDDAPAAPPVVDDETPTQKFPPIRETVLRRPPPPQIRELHGSELLRALADQIDNDPSVTGDESGADL